MRTLQTNKGIFTLESGVTVAWNGMGAEQVYVKEDMWHAEGVQVDLVTGRVVTHHCGTLIVAQGDRVYPGPYDGGVLDIDTFIGVSWRGKQLDHRRCSPQRLVFEDGCEVILDDEFVGVPTGVLKGQLRLDVAKPKSPQRARRRILARPGATRLRDSPLVYVQGEPTPWPPPEPERQERAEYGRNRGGRNIGRGRYRY